jgi:hypothetical protein
MGGDAADTPLAWAAWSFYSSTAEDHGLHCLWNNSHFHHLDSIGRRLGVYLLKRWILFFFLLLTSACRAQQIDLGTRVKSELRPGNIIYVNDGSATNPCTGTGALAQRIHGAWNCSGGTTEGGLVRPKPSIDVRDAGADCTGATDSSRALNTLFMNITGKRVIIPNGCQLKVLTGLVLNGQSSFVIEGNNHQGVVPGGSSIGGCNGSATGVVLTINRSAYFELRDFALYNMLPGCSSTNFTQNILFTNTGSGGVTPTYARFQGLSLSTSLNGISQKNYVGFEVGGGQNLEQVTLEDNLIVCQNSPNSYGVWQDGGNADDFLVMRNRIEGCFQAVRADTNSVSVINNHLSSNGNYSVFGANGANIYLGNLIYPTNIISNNETDGGPFLNMGNNCSASTPNSPVNIQGNYIGPSDMASNQYIIGAGCSFSNPLTLVSNRIVSISSPAPKAVVGNSVYSSPNGAYGSMIQHGNTFGFVGTPFPFEDSTHWQWGEFEPDSGLNTFDLIYSHRNAYNGTSSGAPRSAKLVFEASGTNGNDDFSLANVPNGATGNSSTLVLDHAAGSPAANTYLAIQPQIAGGMNVVAVPNPVVTAGTDYIQNFGTAGLATWRYELVGISGNGCHTAAGSAITTTTGNSTLNSSNYNIINYVADPGVIYYNVYRTASGGTPSTTGLIGTLYVSAVNNSSRSGTNQFNDTGLAGDSSTPPATNTCTGIFRSASGIFSEIRTPNLLVSATAPSISSGFGTSPSIPTNNGIAAFTVKVGTGGTASSGVIGLPTAATGWNCFATDITTTSATVFMTKQTASTTTSATFGNFNTSGAVAAWADSDILSVSCFAR